MSAENTSVTGELDQIHDDCTRLRERVDEVDAILVDLVKNPAYGKYFDAANVESSCHAVLTECTTIRGLLVEISGLHKLTTSLRRLGPPDRVEAPCRALIGLTRMVLARANNVTRAVRDTATSIALNVAAKLLEAEPKPTGATQEPAES
jgi:hypothetical protein